MIAVGTLESSFCVRLVRTIRGNINRKNRKGVRMIGREIDVKRAPTKSQMKMLEASARHPICFDEDCPELADDDLVKFQKLLILKKSLLFTNVIK